MLLTSHSLLDAAHYKGPQTTKLESGIPRSRLTVEMVAGRTITIPSIDQTNSRLSVRFIYSYPIYQQEKEKKERRGFSLYTILHYCFSIIASKLDLG